jgi:hypothetical protein
MVQGSQDYRVHTKVDDESPSTPSTKVSSKEPSTDALPFARDHDMFPDECSLMLPGIVRRIA